MKNHPLRGWSFIKGYFVKGIEDMKKLVKTLALGAALAAVGAGNALANPVMPVVPPPPPGPGPMPWGGLYGSFAAATGEVATTSASAAFSSAGQGLGMMKVITTEKITWRPFILNAEGLSMQDKLELVDVIINNKSRVSENAIRRELGKVKPGKTVKLSDVEKGGLLIGDLADAMCIINVMPVEARMMQPGQPPQGRPPQGEPTVGKPAQPPVSMGAGAPPSGMHQPPGGEKQSAVSPSGRYRLVVTVVPKGKDIWGAIGFGNGGYKYTGRYQGTLMVNAANLARQGDVLTIGGLYTGSDERSGIINYYLPAVTQGARFDFFYQRTAYSVGDMYEFLGIEGVSNTLRFGYHQNLTRHQNHNLYMDFLVTRKQIGSIVNGIAIYGQPRNEGTKRSHAFTLGFRGDFTDKWAGGGKTNWAISYTQGVFNPMAGFAVRDPRPIGHDTAGAFGRWNSSLSREQKVAKNLKLFVGVDAQYTNNDLDSAERMILGGPLGVRAYGVSEASGNRAILGKMELRWTLPKAPKDRNNWELIAFVDGAASRVNTHPNATDRRNNREIYGWGLGVNWRNDDDWMARVAWARPLGNNDPLTEQKRSSRVWFQLFKFF